MGFRHSCLLDLIGTLAEKFIQFMHGGNLVWLPYVLMLYKTWGRAEWFRSILFCVNELMGGKFLLSQVTDDAYWLLDTVSFQLFSISQLYIMGKK